MVKSLIDNRTDIAIGYFGGTSARFFVTDFSPVLTATNLISILSRKNSYSPSKAFAFLSVFDETLWIAIASLFIVVVVTNIIVNNIVNKSNTKLQNIIHVFWYFLHILLSKGCHINRRFYNLVNKLIYIAYFLTMIIAF